MTSIFYILAIIIVGASAVFSYLNKQKHIGLTSQTYKLRVVNDQLERDIKFRQGRDVKVEDIADEGDRISGGDPEVAYRLITQRVITGLKDSLNFIPFEEQKNPTGDGSPYKREVDGKMLEFSAYNILLKNLNEGKDKGQVAYVETEAENEPQAKGKKSAADAVENTLLAYVGETLRSKITQLKGDISIKEAEKVDLSDQIEQYVAAERRIKDMFQAENITTLQGGQDKLKSLETNRKRLLSAQDSLQKEGAALTDRRNRNKETLGDHSEYFASRKISLSSNEKFFTIAAVDFEWGFALIAKDQDTRFLVNQRLMVLRGGRNIGELIVSSVEPDRIMANINYDSVARGVVFRRGDKVISLDPADQ